MQGRIQELGLTEDFRIPSISKIMETITPNTKLIYLANPNTPTGNLVASREQINELLDLPLVVIVDECYYELTDFSVSDLLSDHENLIISRSLSKTYGLAGLRIGYLIAHEKLTKRLRNIGILVEPFSPVLSLVGAIAAVEDVKHLQNSLCKLQAAREKLRHGLESLDIIVYPSETTALLLDTVQLGINAQQFVNNLANQGVITKTCKVYGYSKETWVYFGVPRFDQVDQVLQKVEESLKMTVV
jgi:histidinol-phosphate aminotransferase